MIKMTQPHSRQRQIAEFIDALGRLDAAGRARLKRNAGRTLGEARDVHRVFYQALPYDVPERQHEDYFLLATLFPMAEPRSDTLSLGGTLRRVRQSRESASLDRRFQALLDSEREQLPFRLRQAVRLAAASEQSIAWGRLLEDLLSWDWENHPVQRRWAKDYYVGTYEPETV